MIDSRSIDVTNINDVNEADLTTNRRSKSRSQGARVLVLVGDGVTKGNRNMFSEEHETHNESHILFVSPKYNHILLKSHLFESGNNSLST